MNETGLGVQDTALGQALLDRLDQFDTLSHGHAATPPPMAREGLDRLIAGLRALLEDHLPDTDGRCPVCSGMVRGRRWPCDIWLTAQRQLLGQPTAAARPHPGLARRRMRSARYATPCPVRDEDVTVRTTPLEAVQGPGDWDSRAVQSSRLTTGELPVTPPIGGHLETDHTKIHRAAVVNYGT